ncbi:unnamed protein product [Colias eurytheme]|nr:unnamed protein product [Colias eurytheme]
MQGMAVNFYDNGVSTLGEDTRKPPSYFLLSSQYSCDLMKLQLNITSWPVSIQRWYNEDGFSGNNRRVTLSLRRGYGGNLHSNGLRPAAEFRDVIGLPVLVPSVGGEYANNTKEQKKIAMKPQQNNLGEPSKTVITVMPADNTKFNNHTENYFKHQENVTRIKSNLTEENVPRQIRRSEGGKEIQCVSCEGRAKSRNDGRCYNGNAQSLVNCSNSEECFTELHPQYIKRGCMSRSRLNRTFICKCPLCNDKPFDDTASYEYKTIRDWEYDNRRLRSADKGMDLICKVCETRGINPAMDNHCKHGKK